MNARGATKPTARVRPVFSLLWQEPPIVQQSDPTSLLHVVLRGAAGLATPKAPTGGRNAGLRLGLK